MKNLKQIPFLLLRIFTGWHFLYEGLNKLLTSDWSAQGYLENSYGFLSGFYHSLAANSSLMPVIDFINVWGLILIGSALFLGVLTRFASVAGILLLLLYYFAYPPFGTSMYASPQGHFWIINRNLIEMVVLSVIYFMPVREYSLMYFYQIIRERVAKKEESSTEQNPQKDLKRREMLKALATLPFFGGMVYASVARETSNTIDGKTGATSVAKKWDLTDLKAPAPQGKLCGLQVSRIIAGCNQLGTYTHSRDFTYVNRLFKDYYNTEAKLFQSFDIFEKTGINTTNMINSGYAIFNAWKKSTGSNMQSICQAEVKTTDRYGNPVRDAMRDIKRARDFGANAICIDGDTTDILLEEERFDLIEEALELIHSFGLPAGIGCHTVLGLNSCAKKGIRPDFYYKTMHPDNISQEKTIEFFKNIDVPLVGFKVMAGGVIPPEDDFKNTFETGADFICVGMFDFQVIENVNLINKVLTGDLNRTRPWH